MKVQIALLSLALAGGTLAAAQSAPAAPAAAQNKRSATLSGARAGDLAGVLSQLDKAAVNFKSATADFEWHQYQKVVDETDVQKGRIYFRRQGNETNMAAEVTDPEKKNILFTDGKIRLYQPRIDQLTEREVGANRGEVESFLVLGFGGRGQDLAKSFDVKFMGWEEIEGVRTAKLDLVPRAVKVRGMFSHIIIWVDPVRGVSLRQQAIEPSGDYRLAHYRNIKLNEKINDDTFKLKTTSKTKVTR